ncbi:hypothetical protein C2E23DRAFT_399507 [Lenzites betulinus]|nr:hypothetical protein C2E23DRAFT_399507 [Lenzites betulinus]
MGEHRGTSKLRRDAFLDRVNLLSGGCAYARGARSCGLTSKRGQIIYHACAEDPNGCLPNGFTPYSLPLYQLAAKLVFAHKRVEIDCALLPAKFTASRLAFGAFYATRRRTQQRLERAGCDWSGTQGGICGAGRSCFDDAALAITADLSAPPRASTSTLNSQLCHRLLRVRPCDSRSMSDVERCHTVIPWVHEGVRVRRTARMLQNFTFGRASYASSSAVVRHTYLMGL